MLPALWELLAFKSLEGREPAREERALRVTILAMIGAAALALFFDQLQLHRPGLTAALIAGIAALGYALWRFTRGDFPAARFLTLIVLLGLLSFVLYTGQSGIHGVTVMMYPAVIVVASLLLGRRGYIVVTLLTILSAVGLVVADVTGVIRTRYHDIAALDDTIAPALFLVFTALMVRLLAADLMRAVDRLRRQEAALAQSHEQLARSNALLAALSRAQTRLLEERTPREVFDGVLSEVLTLTSSRYGFIGEVLQDEAGAPYLKAFAVTDISWDDESRRIFAAHAGTGMEFRNLDTLFGQVLQTGTAVVSNGPDDLRNRGAMPHGHPALDTFMGLPFRAGGRLTGMLGVANRPGGYDEALVRFLEPLVTTCSNMIDVIRNRALRDRAEDERRALEVRMQQAQKLESLGVMAGGIAHDFNNLLMAILGNLEIAADTLPETSPLRRPLAAAEKASLKAADLTRQMLAYSGKGRFVIERINLGQTVREMSQMLEASISKKATLRLVLPPDLPPIAADAAQLRQVIVNLVSNASEALGDRSGDITISTGVSACTRDDLSDRWLHQDLPEGLYVSFSVADTGCGMDKATLSRVFDPFFSTKFTGRGLGLPAVLGIARGHRAAVTVDSEAGRGTTIRIRFPAAPAGLREEATDALPRRAEDGQGTVLLVDDESSLREVGQLMLQRLGYHVLLAADGERALEIVNEKRADIRCVVLDLTMPNMDGAETFRAIRRLDPRVRVIVSSGFDGQDIASRFGGAGPDGFLQKPYTMRDLGDGLKAILGG
jgi:signal transduction histidine kinase/CheY-like chemotaxis protein